MAVSRDPARLQYPISRQRFFLLFLIIFLESNLCFDFSMQTVARFETPEQAHLLRSYLEAEGISSHVFDEYVIQWFWYYSGAMGGVRVVVANENYSQAAAVYQAYLDRQMSDPTELTVARGGLWVVLLSLITNVPALFFGRRRVEGSSLKTTKKSRPANQETTS